MSITFLTDEDKVLRYDEQNLTEEQKARARANIGAASEDIAKDIDVAVENYLAENPVTNGMTATMRNLMKHLFSAAVYTSDQSANIEMLSAILDNQDSISYDITSNLTFVSIDNAESSVMRGNPYIASLTVAEGFEMVNVSVVMGGVDVTETVYDGEGNITIPSVTGAVVITAVAEEVEYLEFTGATVGYLGINDENTGMMVIKDTQNRAILLPLGMDLDKGATYRALIGAEYAFSVSTYSATGKDLDFSTLANDGGFWWRAGPRVVYSNSYVNEYEFTATADNEVLGVVVCRADNAALTEEDYAGILASFKMRVV